MRAAPPSSYGCLMPLPVEDYALLSDTQSAALVGKDGSIDWLTFPRFDSAACFAALLGTPEHGRWLMAPAGGIKRVTRRYLPGTMVLETVFECETGIVALTDCMPVRDHMLDLVRLVECRSGSVDMRTHLVVRMDYGSIVPWVRRVNAGVSMVAGPDALLLRSPIQLRGQGLSTVGEFRVQAGDRVPFHLSWHPSHERPRPAASVERSLATTIEWWERWSARSTHDFEPYTEAVERSLLTLKALTYEPTGGIVAAATTSLPELVGGERNWDYRFCWLRDATLSLISLLRCGHTEEARAWRDWLLRAVAGRPEHAQIMYGAAGERRLSETTIDWLPGYEGSLPVRVGNAAHAQFQLDVYGEVLDALYQAQGQGIKTNQATWAMEKALVEMVATRWNEPDDGLWEIRSERRHFTHSKVMAWVALDRAVRSAEEFGLSVTDLARWRRLRAEIRADVLENGVDSSGVFVQSYGSRHLDASLLMVPLVGFLPATDPRVIATAEAIQRELTTDGFVHRYDPAATNDGLGGSEGSFLMCTFWLADNLALMGRTAQARGLFERLLSIRNDVGLLAEQYDPVAGRQLGNFPQAFSHVALIDTASALTDRQETRLQRT